ncbi:MAG: hypothetical protein IKB22_01400 [Lentisphaeria bacterium]|nr:hypothetical protein [Lentisphaeria bacterium]
MAKLMLNTRTLQAIRNGLARFDTETLMIEILLESGEWVEAGLLVDAADTVTNAGTVTQAENVVNAENVENVTTYNMYTVSEGDVMMVLTQAEYDSITDKDENMIYIIKDE